jgi:hypothetical protein
MIFFVLSIQEKKYNKTVRYLEKRGFDYKVLIPDCLEENIAKSYKEKAIVYNTELCKSYVDFCGTNITNGASVGRVASILEAKKNEGISVCLDDDYGGIVASKPINTYTKDKLINVIERLHELTLQSGIIFGGYSGGAMPMTKKNIMQIWIMDYRWTVSDLNMILNEDVNFSISKWQRGIANFGLATILRSGAQTAEMDKIDGNTKHIYATDRSYRKSFGSILQDPNNAKLVVNKHNTKRGALWHHRISWEKLCPMILDKNLYIYNN